MDTTTFAAGWDSAPYFDYERLAGAPIAVLSAGRRQLLAGFTVFFFGAGHVFFQAGDACAVGWMRGGEFGWLGPGTALFHAFPESDGFVRIVPGARHVIEPDFVSFGFVVAAEGKENAVLSACAECSHDFHFLARVHIAQGE